jgi:hypothetical protein
MDDSTRAITKTEKQKPRSKNYDLKGAFERVEGLTELDRSQMDL